MEPFSNHAAEPFRPGVPPQANLRDSATQRLSARGHLGGYRLLGSLGRGGMGQVFRALDPNLGREVALKVMLTSGLTSSDRFIREARLTAELDHPGVVRVHDAGVDEGHAYIVYELVEGARTLDQVARLIGRGECCALIAQAARAVGAAHERGIVHRDLKPDNLLVDGGGRLRVLDFGVARGLNEERLTNTGQMLGTPMFMAPEQMIDGKHAGPPADVWALGVLLYQALTDQLPFQAATLTELLVRVQNPVVPPRRLEASVDPGLEAVCLRALERDPARRFADGQAMAEALEDALARPRPRSGRRWLLALAAFAGSLAAAGLLLLNPGAETERSASSPPATSRSPTTAPSEALAPIRDRVLLETTSPNWAVWVDARRVVTGGPTVDARLWDAATGRELRAWPRRITAAVRCGAGRVALASDAGLSLLDVDAESERPTSLGHFVSVRQVAYAAAADAVAVIAQEGGSERWGVFIVSAEGVRREARVPADSGELVSIATSADGRLLGVGTRADDFDSAQMRVLSPGGPALVFRERGGQLRLAHTVTLPSFGLAAAYNSRTRDLLFGTGGGRIGVVPHGSGDVMSQFSLPEVKTGAHSGSVACLAVSHDGTRLYSLVEHERGSELRAWDYDSRKAHGAALHLSGRPRSLDLSPDGATLVIGTAERVTLRAVGR